MQRPIVFLSYAHGDNHFVERLATDLEKRGAEVWRDSKSIKVGDSISAAVEKGLSTSDFVCLALSKESVSRPWVLREYRAALNLQLRNADATPRILPIFLDDAECPTLLRDIRYADFRNSYRTAFEELCETLGIAVVPAPFVHLLQMLGHERMAPAQEFFDLLRRQDVLRLSDVWRGVEASAEQLLSELQASESRSKKLRFNGNGLVWSSV